MSFGQRPKCASVFMDPEGLTRTSISVEDSDAHCQLSYPGAAREVYADLQVAIRDTSVESSGLLRLWGR